MGFRGHGIVILDFGGQITFANTSACELVGISTQEFDGLSCFDFVFEEDRELAEALLEANKTPESKPVRFRLRRKNGSAVWVQIRGSAINTANALCLELSLLLKTCEEAKRTSDGSTNPGH